MQVAVGARIDESAARVSWQFGRPPVVRPVVGVVADGDEECWPLAHQPARLIFKPASDGGHYAFPRTAKTLGIIIRRGAPISLVWQGPPVWAAVALLASASVA